MVVERLEEPTVMDMCSETAFAGLESAAAHENSCQLWLCAEGLSRLRQLNSQNGWEGSLEALP